MRVFSPYVFGRFERKKLCEKRKSSSLCCPRCRVARGARRASRASRETREKRGFLPCSSGIGMREDSLSREGAVLFSMKCEIENRSFVSSFFPSCFFFELERLHPPFFENDSHDCVTQAV